MDKSPFTHLTHSSSCVCVENIMNHLPMQKKIGSSPTMREKNKNLHGFPEGLRRWEFLHPSAWEA